MRKGVILPNEKGGCNLKHLFFILFIFLPSLVLNNSFAFALDAIDQAQLYLENGENERAIQILKPLLKSEDENELAQAVEVLYSIYSEKTQNQEAVNALQIYIAKFPQTQSAYLYRYWVAKIEEDNKNYSLSLKILKEVAFQYPQDLGDPYNTRQQAMEDIAHHLEYYQEKYQEAIDAYLMILSSFPDYEEKSRLYIQIASNYEKMGKNEKALEYYQRIREQEINPYYLDLAEMRIEYLRSDPVWARKNPAVLIKELRDAFTQKNLKALEQLAKKGDFWTGQIYSEFELIRFSQIVQYFETYLPQSNLQVHPAEKKENEYVIKISSWGDPDFPILYLYVGKGIYGWEWSKIVLSSPDLEYQVDSIYE